MQVTEISEIQTRRQAMKATRGSLAKAAKISVVYLWELETGEKTNPSFAVMKRLNAALESLERKARRRAVRSKAAASNRARK